MEINPNPESLEIYLSAAYTYPNRIYKITYYGKPYYRCDLCRNFFHASRILIADDNIKIAFCIGCAGPKDKK